MGPDLFDAIGTYNKRTKQIETASGKVVSVHGNTAWVQVNGSSQLSEVFFNKGTVIAPADDVTLKRTKRNPRWVIDSSFGNQNAATPVGNSGLSGQDGADGTDAAIGNLYTIVDGAQTNIAHGTTPSTLKTLLITPQASTKVLIGCNLTFEASQNTFYLCNAGVEFNSTYRVCSSVVALRDSGWPMNGRWPAPFTTIVTGLTAGVQNTVYIKATIQDVVSFSLSANYFIWDTWVLEV